MKKLQQCTAIVLATLGAVYCAGAQDYSRNNSTATMSQRDTYDDGYYKPMEFSVDLFGMGAISDTTINHLSTTTAQNNSLLGGGAGLNFFFCRYLGVGADAITADTHSVYLQTSSANLIFRLPIGNTGLAPYVYGGGGYEFDEVNQVFGQAGAGLEFRFVKHVGIFADARYVFTDKTTSYGLGRAGLRLNF